MCIIIWYFTIKIRFLRSERKLTASRAGKQVPLAEKAKAFRRIQVREFGKLVPYLRYKGCLLIAEQVAVTSFTRLFNKNVVG